jgi:xylulokinase
MDGLFLGIDVGTQSTKVLVLDAASGEIAARASKPYGLITGLPEGAAEQDPDTWVDAIRSSMNDVRATLGRRAAEIRAVGVSGQQHGLVVLDENDRAVRPAKLWCDTTTSAEARELSNELGREVPAGFTAPKILWMKRREPDRWAQVRSILLPHDYVNFRLTGEKRMEAGDASGTGLFDPTLRTFDPRSIALIGPELSKMIPPIALPGQTIGRLSKEGSELLGLSAEVLVSTGGGDNMMSAIGSGATRPGVFGVSLGTSGTVFAYSDRPIADPDGLVAAFCDSTGGWLPLLCVMNMTQVVAEIAGAFSGENHASLTARARETGPGAKGLILLPYLQGERVPNLPEACGVIFGLKPGRLDAGALYRAALEGTIGSLALGVDRMRGLGLSAHSVRLAGGGSQNALWAEITADMLEVPVSILSEPESAALGAAIQALWTSSREEGDELEIDALASRYVEVSRTISPVPERYPIYRSIRDEISELTRRIFGER